jgi:3-hydroxy-9,10-secoandrosta-1,3,5(10)-triene-9,17-dione monooxygenase
MPHFDATPQSATKQEILDRVRAIAPSFGERAGAAEEARRISEQSAQDMLAAGLARILMPKRFGGYELDFETWLDVVLEISRFDASHGWCAALIIHHAHLVGQYPEEAQQAVWAQGPDVAIAASFAPAAQAIPADGGYRLSGQHSGFASGVNHSSWVIIGAMAQEQSAEQAGPPWKFFLVPPGEYQVRDTWFTTGMRATGSNTIVTDNVLVPNGRVLALPDLRNGTGPRGNESLIYHTLFFHYAPLTFVAPMLGAAQGAYRQFRDWTRTRKAQDGSPVAEKTSIQVRMARAAADLDAAELLLRRIIQVPYSADARSPQLLARSVRDYARAAEIVVAAIDAIIAMCGTAGFTTASPIQRAWRDIHFAATHISINPETNLSHFGRMELGLGRDPKHPYF